MRPARCVPAWRRGSSGEREHFGSRLLTLDPQVVSGLKPEPELRARAEEFTEPHDRSAGTHMTRSASPPAATTTDSNDEFTPADARAPWS